MHKKCSHCSIEHASWISRGFKGNDVIHLHATNKEVTSHDYKKIIEVGHPIALVEAENAGRGKSMKEDNFGALASKLCLHVGAKVLLIRN